MQVLSTAVEALQRTDWALPDPRRSWPPKRRACLPEIDVTVVIIGPVGCRVLLRKIGAGMDIRRKCEHKASLLDVLGMQGPGASAWPLHSYREAGLDSFGRFGFRSCFGFDILAGFALVVVGVCFVFN